MKILDQERQQRMHVRDEPGTQGCIVYALLDVQSDDTLSL